MHQFFLTLLFLSLFSTLRGQELVATDSIDFTRLFEDKSYALDIMPDVAEPFEVMEILLQLAGLGYEAKGWKLCEHPRRSSEYWRHTDGWDARSICQVSKQEVGLFLIEGLLQMNETYWEKGWQRWYYQNNQREWVLLQNLSHDQLLSIHLTTGLGNQARELVYEEQNGIQFWELYLAYRSWYFDVRESYSSPKAAMEAGEKHPLQSLEHYKREGIDFNSIKQLREEENAIHLNRRKGKRRNSSIRSAEGRPMWIMELRKGVWASAQGPKKVETINFERLFESPSYAISQLQHQRPSYRLLRRLLEYEGSTTVMEAWHLEGLPEANKAPWRAMLYPEDHLPNRHYTKQAIALFLIEALLRQDSTFWRRDYALPYFKSTYGKIKGMEGYYASCNRGETFSSPGIPRPKNAHLYHRVFSYYRKWLRESWWMGYKNPAQAHAKRRKLPLDGFGFAWDREDLK